MAPTLLMCGRRGKTIPRLIFILLIALPVLSRLPFPVNLRGQSPLSPLYRFVAADLAKAIAESR